MDIIIELLIAEREKLTKRLKEVDEKLSEAGYDLSGLIKDSINEVNNSSKNHYSHFKIDGSIREQALEVLKTENRFMFKKEIVDILMQFHKSRGLDKLTSRVTSELSNSKDKVENLISYQFGTSKQDTVWGNKAWLDENGKPYKEYMYNTDKEREQIKMFSF